MTTLMVIGDGVW